jgi:hypothetical protein
MRRPFARRDYCGEQEECRGLSRHLSPEILRLRQLPAFNTRRAVVTLSDGV